MINIDSVELSKTTVDMGEVLIIRISATELFATWGDLLNQSLSWNNIGNKTWDNVRLKIF